MMFCHRKKSLDRMDDSNTPICINLEENGMLSKIPIDLRKMKNEDIDKGILRAGIIAELDAINLYEEMAALTKNPNTKRVLLDIAKEEKTHVGEFQTLLLMVDKEQAGELDAGKNEIEELIGKSGR